MWYNINVGSIPVFGVVSVALQHLVAVSCVGVAEPLDVVEDQPGERDDHQDDEGDGDEHH